MPSVREPWSAPPPSARAVSAIAYTQGKKARAPRSSARKRARDGRPPPSPTPSGVRTVNRRAGRSVHRSTSGAPPSRGSATAAKLVTHRGLARGGPSRRERRVSRLTPIPRRCRLTPHIAAERRCCGAASGRADRGRTRRAQAASFAFGGLRQNMCLPGPLAADDARHPEDLARRRPLIGPEPSL